MRWWFFVSFLVAITVTSLGLSFRLMNERIDLTETNKEKVQSFFSRLANSQISFAENGEIVFPDEKKFLNYKKNYIENEASFVEVDLRKMIVSLYGRGLLLKTLPVTMKGREGSWWETPTGNYKAILKERNHFSSIGKVWMPYSIQFYGNFFIHGLPYYENGESVASSYTGGCVRLNTEDAKTVFDFVEKDMPILILDEELKTDYYGYLEPREESPNLPSISAKSFLISDLRTHEVILEKNADEPLPMASITKLMTGVVASELIYLERSIKISSKMLESAYESFPFSPEKRYTAFELFYPLLMQSSNGAANALASFIGQGEFVKKMNDKAISLGMIDSSFQDPSGIGDMNISTTHDISRLLQYIYYKRNFIFDITKGKKFINFGPVELHTITNFNDFYENENLLGAKTGKTNKAKETLATVWNFKTPKGDVPISIIVFGSDNRRADVQKLVDWVRGNFKIL